LGKKKKGKKKNKNNVTNKFETVKNEEKEFSNNENEDEFKNLFNIK
jgi:hypothetical protein